MAAACSASRSGRPGRAGTSSTWPRPPRSPRSATCRATARPRPARRAGRHRDRRDRRVPGFVATPIVRNSVLIGLPADQTERLRGFGDRALSRLGYPPERLARRIVTAIERDTAVVSATPDGHLL